MTHKFITTPNLHFVSKFADEYPLFLLQLCLERNTLYLTANYRLACIVDANKRVEGMLKKLLDIHYVVYSESYSENGVVSKRCLDCNCGNTSLSNHGLATLLCLANVYNQQVRSVTILKDSLMHTEKKKRKFPLMHCRCHIRISVVIVRSFIIKLLRCLLISE